MATDPETAADPKPARTVTPVEKLNVEAPIWVAIDQAENRNYFEVFNGWDAEQEAKDWAAERSARLKRPVILVGPQDSVARPPEKPVGEVQKVRLTKPPEPEGTAAPG